jgi:transcription elongation factor GreA
MEYMSQEGYDKLVAELRHMESVELPLVREAIAEARDKGDLSENFEYHAAKREQARLLGRIRFKQRVLENARVIDMSRLNSDCVQLLSKVQMTNLATNKTMTFTIASPHEANIREGKISIKSPIAQALLNKKVGDEVSVRVPAGLMKLRIDHISLDGEATDGSSDSVANE